MDSLSRLTISRYDQLNKILVEYLEYPSINTEEEIQQTRVGVEPSWIDLILNFINNGTLPSEPFEAR